MHRRFWIALVMVACAAVVPAVALAGKTVVSGQQSLQLRAGLKSNKAGAQGVTLRFHSDYLSTQPGGQQPPYNTKSVIFTMPKGLQINNSAAPRCRESSVINAATTMPACPANTRVGQGTVILNARPTVPTLINATVTVYNGVDDGGYGGYPKNSPMLVLYVKSSIGINANNFFHVVKGGPGVLKLIGTSTQPAQAGVLPGSFTLQTLDLSVSGSAKKPFVSNPPTCSGSWPFSLTVTNYFGQPSVTAQDRVKCSK